MLKIYAVFGVVMATMIGGGYWYYIDSQARQQRLVTELANVQTELTFAKHRYETLEKDYVAAFKIIDDMNKNISSVRDHNNRLKNELSNIDESSDPADMSIIVNDFFTSQARCIELQSGAELNEREKSAKTGEEFNRSCPWLFDTMVN